VNDEGEIRTLLARVGELCDQGPVDAYLALFRQDAVVTMTADEQRGTPESSNRGLDEIRASLTERRAAQMLGPDSDTCHVLSTVAITITDADRAIAESVFQFFTNASTTPTLVSIGAYHDVVVREADGWKLAERTITRD